MTEFGRFIAIWIIYESFVFAFLNYGVKIVGMMNTVKHAINPNAKLQL